MASEEVSRKTSAVLAVSIVLASILFCPIAMAVPPMPDDLQMVEPDPSLPKEIAGFWGKWEGGDRYAQYFVIIEKIDGERASVYRYKSGNVSGGAPDGWARIEAKVTKEYGKYKLWYPTFWGGYSGIFEYTLKGKYMDCSTSNPILRSFRLIRSLKFEDRPIGRVYRVRVVWTISSPLFIPV